jgi:hypothetical protein
LSLALGLWDGALAFARRHDKQGVFYGRDGVPSRQGRRSFFCDVVLSVTEPITP